MLSRGGTRGQVRLGAGNRAWQRDLRHMEASSGPRRRADGPPSCSWPGRASSESWAVCLRLPACVWKEPSWRGSETSLVAQTVKRLPTMQDTRVQCLGQEDPLEKEMAIHSSILVWRIPWTEEPGGLQSTASQSVKTRLSDFTFTWKRTEGRLWVTPSPSDRQEPLATQG